MEVTYAMIKPEFANEPKVIREIEKRIINAGLAIKRAKFIRYTREAARVHYAEHYVVFKENPEKKKFYPDLENYIVSDKAFGIVVEGDNAIAKVRALVSDIRRDIPDLCHFTASWSKEDRMTKNVIHASDKLSSALSEIQVFDALPALTCSSEQDSGMSL